MVSLARYQARFVDDLWIRDMNFALRQTRKKFERRRFCETEIQRSNELLFTLFPLGFPHPGRDAINKSFASSTCGVGNRPTHLLHAGVGYLVERKQHLAWATAVLGKDFHPLSVGS